MTSFKFFSINIDLFVVKNKLIEYCKKQTKLVVSVKFQSQFF
jgi:hypothetical protein